MQKAGVAIQIEVGSASVAHLIALAGLVGELAGLVPDQERAGRIKEAALAELEAVLAGVMRGASDAESPAGVSAAASHVRGSGSLGAGGAGNEAAGDVG